VFGHVEHGHAAALGGGEVVHGLKPFLLDLSGQVHLNAALKPVSEDTKSHCAVKPLRRFVPTDGA
jgi:hypothetical protein